MELRTKGIWTLVGGIILHLCLGSIYIWGNISVYVTSYLRHYDDSLTLEDTFIILPIILVMINIILYFGSYLTLRFSPKLTWILGMSLFVGGTFASSFTTDFPTFAMCYGGVTGTGMGFIYMSPIIASWSYFPEKKGAISGIITGSLGISAAIFDPLSTYLVNPDNESPDIEEKNGDIEDHYYTYDIASRVPAMIRWLCLIYIIMAIVGTILVFEINRTGLNATNLSQTNECPSI